MYCLQPFKKVPICKIDFKQNQNFNYLSGFENTHGFIQWLKIGCVLLLFNYLQGVPK